MEITNLLRAAEKESTVFFVREVSEITGKSYKCTVQELSRRDLRDVLEALNIIKENKLSGEALWRVRDIYNDLVSTSIPTGWFESKTKYEVGSVIEKEDVKITHTKEKLRT